MEQLQRTSLEKYQTLTLTRQVWEGKTLSTELQSVVNALHNRYKEYKLLLLYKLFAEMQQRLGRALTHPEREEVREWLDKELWSELEGTVE